FAFDRIGLGNFQGEKVHEVDELRIGTTYRAVTGRRDRGGERLLPPVALNLIRSASLASARLPLDGGEANRRGVLFATYPLGSRGPGSLVVTLAPSGPRGDG
ncbi:MAG: hypothetical protein AAF805_01635, partial [Planctomycetota bacterium]